MAIGDDGCETRVRDGLLEIRTASMMVGYLNHASPFTEDGWLMTGDRVEVRQDGAAAQAQLSLDPSLPRGCVRIPAGVAGSESLGDQIAVVTVSKA
jgi:hypothetical protein